MCMYHIRAFLEALCLQRYRAENSVLKLTRPFVNYVSLPG